MSEIEVRRTATVDDIEAVLGNTFQAAYDNWLAKPEPQIAAPLYWWDLYAYGPIQPFITSPGLVPPTPLGKPNVLPNKIIQVGQPAYVVTWLYLSPIFPKGLSACNILSQLGCFYEIDYYLGELERWSAGPAQNPNTGQFKPGHSCWYQNTLILQGLREGLYELNITARILNCDKHPMTPFAGFCSAIEEIDDSIFGPHPGGLYDRSIRFMVYQ